MIMENVITIQAELKDLVEKAIEILEKNYNTEDVESGNPAAMLSLQLENALFDVSDLDEQGLK